MRGESTALNLLVIFALAVLVTAFALPTYRSYTLREHNKLARMVLEDIVAKYPAWQKQHPGQRPLVLEELGFPSNSIYVSADGTTGPSANLSAIYRVSLVPAEAPPAQSCGLGRDESGFVLQADPIQTQRIDTLCARLCLSSTGQKAVSGSAGTRQCWGAR